VIAAVNPEDAAHLQACAALRRNAAAHVFREEDDLGIAGALQHFLVHLAIARAVAALPAGGVHHDLPVGVARLGIDQDVAALQFEGSMHGVENVSECPFNLGLYWIQHDLHLLRHSADGSKEKDERDRTAQPNQSTRQKIAGFHAPVLVGFSTL